MGHRHYVPPRHPVWCPVLKHRTLALSASGALTQRLWMWISTSIVLEALVNIEARLRHMERHIMAAIDDLRARVEANRSVVDSAVTLLAGLKKALDDAIASGDPAALQAISDDLANETSSLAAAVAANTPAAPATP